MPRHTGRGARAHGIGAAARDHPTAVAVAAARPRERVSRRVEQRPSRRATHREARRATRHAARCASWGSEVSKLQRAVASGDGVCRDQLRRPLRPRRRERGHDARIDSGAVAHRGVRAHRVEVDAVGQPLLRAVLRGSAAHPVLRGSAAHPGAACVAAAHVALVVARDARVGGVALRLRARHIVGQTALGQRHATYTLALAAEGRRRLCARRLAAGVAASSARGRAKRCATVQPHRACRITPVLSPPGTVDAHRALAKRGRAIARRTLHHAAHRAARRHDRALRVEVGRERYAARGAGWRSATTTAATDVVRRLQQSGRASRSGRAVRKHRRRHRSPFEYCGGRNNIGSARGRRRSRLQLDSSTGHVGSRDGARWKRRVAPRHAHPRRHGATGPCRFARPRGKYLTCKCRGGVSRHRLLQSLGPAARVAV
mmetsp:Transcript_8810/g.27877  ORF Transcript_8810/g.27877 Transcript_8810/m.27877 type:complete len:430 (-) Transcript_8810:263-1552(-)